MTGIVIKTFGLYYTVLNGEDHINCVLRGRLRKDKELNLFSDPVAVGDVVDFEMNDDDETGVIDAIQQRRNTFTRSDGFKKKDDLIAANLDQIVVVQSFKKPRLNLRFVDRLVVRGEKEGIPVVLCANKVDLAKSVDKKFIDSYYKGSGLNVVLTSAETGRGVKELKKLLAGKLSIFVGSSGVGKSTILNSISPGLGLRISEVSESTGKGRHTTTNAEMVFIDHSARIIDTPGVREFGLSDIEPHLLGQYFYEFRDYEPECKFTPCSHDHEPHCEVKRKVEEGIISEERYVSYLHILNSLREYYDNRY